MSSFLLADRVCYGSELKQRYGLHEFSTDEKLHVTFCWFADSQKMPFIAPLLLLAAFAGTGVTAFQGPSLAPTVPRSRIVADHSFVPPLLSSAWSQNLPHWEVGLGAVVSNGHVRLTPTESSREGCLWNTVPNRIASWTAHVGFRVHSKMALGGDGFALWLTDRQQVTGGPMVGLSNRDFRGLGVVFDSFDNDERRDNPAVHVLYGAKDDAQTFSTSSDFMGEKLGGCVFDFRNTQRDQLVYATVAYNAAAERVTVTLRSPKQEVQCASVDGVVLPPGYHFGMTAHTGGVMDNHDVAYFALVSDTEDEL